MNHTLYAAPAYRVVWLKVVRKSSNFDFIKLSSAAFYILKMYLHNIVQTQEETIIVYMFIGFCG